jgi:hypothetical protein
MRPFLFLLFCLFSTGLHAQDIPIRINVTTDSLRPIPNADVHLSAGKERPFSGSTDSSGAIRVSVHPNATYTIDITAPGYAVLTGTLYPDSAHTTFKYKLQKS